ncbi:MAG: hypothetical protein WCJ72_10740 [Chryseobacterium sp.]
MRLSASKLKCLKSSLKKTKYNVELLNKLNASNRKNLGSTSSLGAVINTQSASRSLLSVINTYLTVPITQAELDIILSNRTDFKFTIGYGDRRNIPTGSVPRTVSI